MKLIRTSLRLLALLSLSLGAVAPGALAPAARADDGQPPDTTAAPDAEAPAQPAGLTIPPTPTGCPFVSGAGGSNHTSQAIHDFSTITSTIHVNGGPYQYLWDAKVTTAIQHTHPGDLEIHLISPAGTDVVLSNHLGSSQAGAF